MLLTGATLVTLDSDDRVLVGGSLRIRDRTIVAVEATHLSATAGETTVDLGGALVLPGLVNGHHHLGATLLRGTAPTTAHGLDHASGRRHDLHLATGSDEAHAGVALALASLVRNGVTTTTDAAAIRRGHEEPFHGALRAAAASPVTVLPSAAYLDRTDLVRPPTTTIRTRPSPASDGSSERPATSDSISPPRASPCRAPATSC